MGAVDIKNRDPVVFVPVGACFYALVLDDPSFAPAQTAKLSGLLPLRADEFRN